MSAATPVAQTPAKLTRARIVNYRRTPDDSRAIFQLADADGNLLDPLVYYDAPRALMGATEKLPTPVADIEMLESFVAKGTIKRHREVSKMRAAAPPERVYKRQRGPLPKKEVKEEPKEEEAREHDGLTDDEVQIVFASSSSQLSNISTGPAGSSGAASKPAGPPPADEKENALTLLLKPAIPSIYSSDFTCAGCSGKIPQSIPISWMIAPHRAWRCNGLVACPPGPVQRIFSCLVCNEAAAIATDPRIVHEVTFTLPLLHFYCAVHYEEKVRDCLFSKLQRHAK